MAQQQQQPIVVGHGDTDYGDYQLMACLLCNRKFKSNHDVTRHQALSDLHKVRHRLIFLLIWNNFAIFGGREGGGCRLDSGVAYRAREGGSWRHASLLY